MLTYSFYENDARVMRYAQALARSGAHVEVLALRRPEQAPSDVIKGVHVSRIQERTKDERGKLQYLTRVLSFFLRSMLSISLRHLTEPYQLVHVHSVPDFEVFAAALPKLLGAKVILDIHDIVPELYAAKFGAKHGSRVFAALVALERWSIRFADHVIIANHIWRDLLVGRSVSGAKCTAYINYPDTSVFTPTLRRRGTDSQFVMIYPGTLNWHQGLDVAIRAMAIAVREENALRLEIYGEGPAKPELQALIAELGLGNYVRIRSPLPLKDIALIMADADLGVVPKRNDAFGGSAFSTKVLEFMALGVPVLLSRTRVDSLYFDDSLVQFFVPGDPSSMSESMLEAYRNRNATQQRARRALDHAQQNSWDVKQHDYMSMVHKLVIGHP